MQKLKKTRRKQKKQKETEKQQKNSKENKKNRNTGFPAHELPRIKRTNYSRRFVGWKSCLLFFMFSFEFFCFFCFYLCFFDCKCKSLKRLGENIKQTERNRKTTEKLEGKQKKQKYRISSPRTSAKNKYL